MKNILLKIYALVVLSAILFTLTGCSTNNINDNQNKNYNEVYRTSVFMLNNEGYVYTWYNINHMELKKAYFDAENNLTSEEKYYYDQEGELIKIEVYSNDKLLNVNDFVSNTNTYYLPDGEIESYTVKTFDQQGNLISETKYDSDDKVLELREYVYDSNNNCVEEIFYSDEIVASRIVNKYIYNYIVEKLMYTGEDVLIEKNTYENDSNGKPLKIVVENDIGDIKHTTKYLYENDYKKTTETLYDLNGEILLKRVLELDEAGLPISSISYNEYGLVSHSQTWKRNEDNKIVKSEYMDSSTTLIYDLKENLLSSTKYDLLGKELEKYEYEYNNNQVIKCNYYINEELVYWAKYDKNGFIKK